jgi:hypothetical protein
MAGSFKVTISCTIFSPGVQPWAWVLVVEYSLNLWVFWDLTLNFELALSSFESLKEIACAFCKVGLCSLGLVAERQHLRPDGASLGPHFPVGSCYHCLKIFSIYVHLGFHFFLNGFYSGFVNVHPGDEGTMKYVKVLAVEYHFSSKSNFSHQLSRD